MMIKHSEPLSTVIVRSASDALELAAGVVGSAIREQLWALFLSDDDRPARLAVPIDGLPPMPEHELLESTASTIGELLRMLGGGSVVLVRERPGPVGISAADAAWEEALRSACARAEVPVRALLLSHDAGVRTLPASLRPCEPEGRR
jgi:hypothetical protein